MFITYTKGFYAKLKIALSILALITITHHLNAQFSRGAHKIKKAKFTFSSDSIKGCVYCLEVSGRIVIAKNNNALAIKIYRDDSLVYVMQSNNASGRFEFYLPFNNKYKVVLAKPGYFDKFITFDTQYTKSKLNAKYELSFTTDMFKTMEGLDVDILKQPLVQMKYNKSDDVFDFDAKYTQSINDKIYKLYSDYRYLQSLDEDVINLAISKRAK